jgi:hypothetical protein
MTAVELFVHPRQSILVVMHVSKRCAGRLCGLFFFRSLRVSCAKGQGTLLFYARYTNGGPQFWRVPCEFKDSRCPAERSRSTRGSIGIVEELWRGLTLQALGFCTMPLTSAVLAWLWVATIVQALEFCPMPITSAVLAWPYVQQLYKHWAFAPCLLKWAVNDMRGLRM